MNFTLDTTKHFQDAEDKRKGQFAHSHAHIARLEPKHMLGDRVLGLRFPNRKTLTARRPEYAYVTGLSYDLANKRWKYDLTLEIDTILHGAPESLEEHIDQYEMRATLHRRKVHTKDFENAAYFRDALIAFMEKYDPAFTLGQRVEWSVPASMQGGRHNLPETIKGRVVGVRVEDDWDGSLEGKPRFFWSYMILPEGIPCYYPKVKAKDLSVV